MSTPSLRAIARYFLILGGTVFGGPLALVTHMRIALVDRMRWLTVAEYQEGLAMATALPGPIAYQLGIYAGWMRRGWAGGLTAAVAFALPPFLICLLGAILYAHFRTSWVIHALFYGIAPVVVALIVKAGYAMGRSTFTTPLTWGIGCGAFAIVAIYRIDPTPIFLIAAVIGIFNTYALTHSRTYALNPLSFALGFFFFKAACILFGSGLVIVPFMQRYVVDQFHWLDTKTFVDAVAVGMMTPGPVVITATFVGYMVDGLAGAVASTIGMFMPSMLFIFLGAPILRRYRTHRLVQGAIGGIAPAVIGVIMASSVGLARTTLVDPLTGGIALVAFGVILRWRIPDIVLILAAGAIGIATHFL